MGIADGGREAAGCFQAGLETEHPQRLQVGECVRVGHGRKSATAAEFVKGAVPERNLCSPEAGAWEAPAGLDPLKTTEATNANWSERLLKACSRETSGGRFIPQIDGLRTLAVLTVVLFHLDDQMGKPEVSGAVDRAFTSLIRRGFLGVPIFFAISAFIVALPFAQRWLTGGKAVGLGRFYLRRLTRLEPPYILNLVAIWLIGAAVGWWTVGGMMKSVGASLLYQHNQLFGEFSFINSVAWSLEVEFQFYLLAPLLTLVFALRRQGLRWLVLAAVCGLVIGLRDLDARRVQLSLIGQFEAFAVGLVVVDVHLTRWSKGPPRKVWLDFVGLAGWLGFFALSRIEAAGLRSALQCGCLLGAFLGSLGGVWLSRVLGNRWVFTFGGMCYSFYLWHQWLLIFGVPWIKGRLGLSGGYFGQYLVVSLLILPPVFAICTALFVWVEKPFMSRDWPQRLAARWRRISG